VLEQVSVKELEDEAVMISKVTLIDHSNDVVFVLRVFLHDVLQVLGLLVGKFVVHLCVSGDLHGQHLLRLALVVSALDHLRKGALTENLHDLIPVSDVVTDVDSIVTFSVVEDRVTLVFTIPVIIALLSSLLFENQSLLLVRLFDELKVVPCSCRDSACVVDLLKLIFFQFFDLFIEELVSEDIQETLT